MTPAKVLLERHATEQSAGQHHGNSTPRRTFSLPEQLGQPRDVDGDAPRLVSGEHLGLPCLRFVRSRVSR
jgi:hypothetical protein